MPETYEEFIQLGIVKDGVYKKIEFCIETMYDICAVINTDLRLGIPEGDESIVDNLHRHKVLSTSLAEIVKDMKGFRNILVHRYGCINDNIAFSILATHLQDFYGFIDEIESFIAKNE